MAQPVTAAKTFKFEFEEIPLIIGWDTKKQGDVEVRVPRQIALITGECEIVHSGTGNDFVWDVDSITLSSPLLHDADVEIKYVRVGQTGHEFWHAIVESIERAKGDEIYDKAMEG